MLVGENKLESGRRRVANDETAEYVPDVIHFGAAIEHVNAHRQCKGQIFRGFCLSRSRRSRRSTPQFQLVRLATRAVNTVRQRGDDQTTTVAQVFVGVFEFGVKIANDEPVVFRIVRLPQLTTPLKLTFVGHLLPDQILNRVTGEQKERG